MPSYRNHSSHSYDLYESNNHNAGRVYAWETVEVEDQDRGANDEGYYYAWCDSCCKRTEHDGGCLECG